MAHHQLLRATSGMHTGGKGFWEHMDAEMRAVPGGERLVVAGGLSGHVGRDRDGYDGVHGGRGLGVRSGEGIG